MIHIFLPFLFDGRTIAPGHKAIDAFMFFETVGAPAHHSVARHFHIFENSREIKNV